MKFERTVVDSHMHVAGLVNKDGVDMYTFFDGLQEEHGLKGLNLCASPICEGWSVENNILCALYKLHNPTAYSYGSFFYPEMPMKLPMPEGLDFLTQYEELLDMGFDGIKMLETKTYEMHHYGIWVDAPYFEDYFAKCEADGTHIVWHVADPETFWDINRIPARHLARGWYYGDGNYPSWEAIYKSVFNVLERHPKLKINFAHFFFYSEHPEWLEEMFQKYPNVGIDVTPGAEMYNAFRDRNEFYREFFIKYADRINFGTDVIHCGSPTGPLRLSAVYNFLTTADEVTVVDIKTKGIALPEDVLEKILHKNFEAQAGEKPKAMDRDKLQNYIDKYKPYIKNEAVIAHLKELGMM